MSAEHWDYFVRKMLLPRIERGSALIMDQLNSHISKPLRALITTRGVHCLYMYSKTAPECSPLDAGLFHIFKDHFRDLLRDTDFSERNFDRLFAITNQALKLCDACVPAMFRKCGLRGPRCNAKRAAGAPLGTVVLPFGKVPHGAKLTRSQVSETKRKSPRKRGGGIAVSKL